jgi:uncharacterized membrane protein
VGDEGMDEVYPRGMNWIIKNFLRGLVIVVPIAITIYVVVEAFLRIDRLLELRTPGLGFALLIVVIVAVGALATNIVGRTLLRLTETIFSRAPIVRIVYAAVKDLLEAFVGDQKRFDKPVAVALTPDGAVRSLGFVTQEDLGFLAMPGHVAVYMPFSYSMSGGLVIVPRERVERLEADSASMMALVVSGGISRVGARHERAPR